MPDRPHEDDRPPPMSRWSLVIKPLCSLIAFFAITQAIFNIPESWPYVAALFLLQIGLLNSLDYRDWVRHKVRADEPQSASSSPVLVMREIRAARARSLCVSETTLCSAVPSRPVMIYARHCCLCRFSRRPRGWTRGCRCPRCCPSHPRSCRISTTGGWTGPRP